MAEKQTFEQWFEGETNKGLVDIKLSVSCTKEATARMAKEEIQQIEMNLENNFVEAAPPTQSSIVSEAADEIICRNVAAGL